MIGQNTIFSYAAEKTVIVELQEIYVKPGDTLHGISTFYLKNPERWPEIYKYNKTTIKDPNIILPRMRIKVPVEMIKEHLRAAHMINIINDVRVRDAGNTEWNKAKLDVKLFNEYSVRTMDKSVAQIKFYSQEIIKLGENSLVVLRPEEMREEAVLKEGELRASRAKILTSSAVIEPRITNTANIPEFKAKIQDDKTTTLSVYKGAVDLTSAGKTVTVNEGFMSVAKLGEIPITPMKLPPMPEFDMETTSIKTDASVQAGMSSELADKFGKGGKNPAEKQSAPAEKGDNIKNILDDTNAASKGIGVKYCHLQIAKDFAFENIIVDKQLENVSDYRKSSLPNGEYFWRMSFVNLQGTEGPFSFPKSFMIDKKYLTLGILYPQDGVTVKDDSIKIKGRTRKNTEVKINGENAFVDYKGNFSKELYLDPGKNYCVIEAKSEQGESAREKITINRQVGEIATSADNKKSAAQPAIIGVISIAILLFLVIVLQ